MLFSAGVPPLTRLGAESEITLQFEDAGIPVRVHAYGRRDPVLIRGRGIVVKLRGSCRDDVGSDLARFRGPMGWTHMTDGEILPIVEIDCESIRLHTLMGMFARDRSLRGLLYARAVGRVIAHEIYHVLAATRIHSTTGLAMPRLSPEDLTDGRLRFDVEAAGRMRRNLRWFPGSGPCPAE